MKSSHSWDLRVGGTRVCGVLQGSNDRRINKPTSAARWDATIPLALLDASLLSPAPGAMAFAEARAALDQSLASLPWSDPNALMISIELQLTGELKTKNAWYVQLFFQCQTYFYRT